MWRIQTTLQTVRWRRVPWRLYRLLLPAPLRHRIARLLALPAPGTRGLSVGRVAWLSLKDFFVDDMTTYGAAMAFHLLLALFPFVIFLVTLLSFLHIPGFFDWLVSQVRIMLPIHTMGQVAAAVRQVRTEAHGGLLSIGIIAALWASSAGMRAVMNAVNVAYDVTESRPIWQRYALSLAFTLGFTALVIAAIALMLVGPEAVAALAAHVHAGLDRVVIAVWTWLRIPVALLLLMLAVALIYYVAPNMDQPFKLLTPGAVLAVVLWLAASFLYSTYVSTFAHYTATYGNIAAIVVLLLYFFISSLALLLGAEVNSVIDCHAPHKREDSRPKAHDTQAPRAGHKHVS
jgi:membrane protein